MATVSSTLLKLMRRNLGVRLGTLSLLDQEQAADAVIGATATCKMSTSLER